MKNSQQALKYQAAERCGQLVFIGNSAAMFNFFVLIFNRFFDNQSDKFSYIKQSVKRVSFNRFFNFFFF
ncbi:MAG: hypothetical protein ACI976_000410 [Aureispira sp.]